MYFDPSKGIQGNIEKSLKEIQYRKNEISNEEQSRQTGDITNETAVCELDSDYAQRLADIENALCELDK